ncbi:hypothetical protein Bca4012_031406 [Brassica carinata]|uniref:Uncharacterized protein n=1 Tax=Brassica carinata TaxID=52824 RepID=A0A8X7UT89_BRACI|nr:hypothetical protein Bca52824_047385 [Brassica carinata]
MLSAAHTDNCSLLPSLLNFSDQRLGFGSVNSLSLSLQHGNVGVGSFYLNSILALSRTVVKLISMSIGVKQDLLLIFPSLCLKNSSTSMPMNETHEIVSLPAIVNMTCSPLLDFHPLSLVIVAYAHQPTYWICLLFSWPSLPKTFMELEMISSSIELHGIVSKVQVFLIAALFIVNLQMSRTTRHQSSSPTRAKVKSISIFCWSISQLEDCSLLAFSLSKKVSQTSSCRGHERFFSIFLFFVR